MGRNDMGKKYLDTRTYTLEASVMDVWDNLDEEEQFLQDVLEEGMKKLDPVGQADGDIDNDGDEDSSDDYLKNRRRAIGRAMKGKKNLKASYGMMKANYGMSEAKQKPYVSSDRDGFHVMNGSGKIVKSFKDKRLAQAYWKKNYDDLMKEGLEDSPNPANSQHLCAKNVVHEEWGEGQPVHGMHAIPDSDGDIAWYDVMFEHGIEKGVSINELKVRAAESHHDHGGKKSKKEGAMKRGKDLDTFKPKSESFEQHQEFKVQSMKEAMQKVWEVAEQDRLFETYADMSDEAFDALLEEADKAQLEGIVGALGRGIKKVATMGTASNRADRAEKKLGKAQVKVDNKARVATAKAKTAQLKKDNPSMVKRAAGAVGSAMMGKKKEI